MRWIMLAALGAAAAIGTCGTAFALDPIGDAGRFRQYKFTICDKGWRAFSNGECDPAPVDQALPAHEKIAAHLTRARELVKFARLQQAAEATSAALTIDPRHLDALKFRARIHASSMTGSSADAALRDIEAGLSISPGEPDLLATRAELLFDRDHTDLALSDANASLKIKPDSADALRIRARILMKLDRLALAERDLDRALKLEPKLPELRLWRAHVYLRRVKVAEAIADATVLIEERELADSALQVRAVAHTHTGDYAGAIADLTAVIDPELQTLGLQRLRANTTVLFIQRALLRLKLGQTNEAHADIDALAAAGAKRAVLQVQLYLKRAGFPDVPIDGVRGQIFDEAIRTCFANAACRRGLITTRT